MPACRLPVRRGVLVRGGYVVERVGRVSCWDGEVEGGFGEWKTHGKTSAPRARAGSAMT